MADSDAAFRAALAKDSDSYRDERVRAVFVMATGLDQAFLPESLKQIDIPVAIVAGAANESSARYLAAMIPHTELKIFEGEVGHFVFMPSCTDAGRAAFPRLCVDAPGADRDAIHTETVHLAEAFFARYLR